MGETVAVSLKDGLLSVHHRGALVATHARRHLPEDDVKFTDQPKVARPATPSLGDVVYRTVDPSGAVSFAGTAVEPGNRFKGRIGGRSTRRR